MPRITKSAVARALANGDLTKADLQEVLAEWLPAKRGRKANLMRQAHVLAAFLLLQQSGRNKTWAREVLMAKMSMSSNTSFCDLLKRARKKWTALPPFEPATDTETGKEVYSVLMFCRDKERFGYPITLQMTPSDWKI